MARKRTPLITPAGALATAVVNDSARPPQGKAGTSMAYYNEDLGQIETLSYAPDFLGEALGQLDDVGERIEFIAVDLPAEGVSFFDQ